VLVAIFCERESHAAYFLQAHGMTRYDAINDISDGIIKGGGENCSLADAAELKV
jgi:ATP-dependent Clp protease ATP-binding subunit ClpA